MKTFLLAPGLLCGAAVITSVSFAEEKANKPEADEQKVEKAENCGPPYHVLREYRQHGEYTRLYYILVDSCGNELSHTLTPAGVYVEM